MLRIGHRGAAALAPPNSVAGFRAALAAGVDMIEFDVAPGLVVAHDAGHAGPALGAFLDQVGELLPAGVGLLVDLKLAGYELEAVAACQAAGLLDRCLFATLERSSIELLRGRVRTSFSFNRRRPGAAAPLLRRVAVERWLRSGADDATIRHSLITPALVETVQERGGRVLAWTVNSREQVGRMRTLGVDGVISDDPRLLSL